MAVRHEIETRLRSGESVDSIAKSLSLDAYWIDHDHTRDGVALPGFFADDGNAKIHFEAAETGLEAAEEYVSDGGYDDHGSVSVNVWRTALSLVDGEILETRVEESSHDIDIEVDHDSLISAALSGEDRETREAVKACSHDWCSPEFLGGLKENPGVWSTGGTSLAIREVCGSCGLYRSTSVAGSQRNPGEAAESYEYEAPDAESLEWIAEGGAQ